MKITEAEKVRGVDYITPNGKIFRGEVRLEDLRYKDKNVQADVKRIARLVKNKHYGNYPWEKLLSQIEEKWNPSCRDTTYHTEPVVYSPFLVLQRVDGGGNTFYTPFRSRHRHSALLALDYDKPIDCFIYDTKAMESVSKHELEKFVDKIYKVIGSGQQYQTLHFPHGVSFNSRDDSRQVFKSCEWSSHFWCGKTVLDVGCHIGYMALEAKRRGADRVVGFDLDGKLIGLGKELSKILDLEIELYNCDFWDFPLWGEKFDIVMAHQCMYHFTTEHRCEYAKQHTEKEMLDLISNSCLERFFSYTFIHDDDKPTTYSEGYRPTKSQIEKDFYDRGYKTVEIKEVNGTTKRTIVASRLHY